MIRLAFLTGRAGLEEAGVDEGSVRKLSLEIGRKSDGSSGGGECRGNGQGMQCKWGGVGEVRAWVELAGVPME